MGTAYTSAATGDWNDSSKWTPTGIPVSGDTATIDSSHTIEVPLAYTAAIGTSPANNSGTVALTINGPLIVNGTLKWQGPVRQGDATVTVGAGGTITYDASGATTPASATYIWEMASNSSQTNAKIVLNGTSGSRCMVNSVGNIPGGSFGINSTNWADIGRIEATYTDFSYLGSSSVDFLKARLVTSIGRLTLAHCTVDNCGQISNAVTDLSGDCTFALTNTKITNPANTTSTLQVNAATAISTGTRKVWNCDIAGKCAFLDTGGAATGFDFKHTILRPYSRSAATPTDALSFAGGGSVAAWDQMLFALCTGPTTADPAVRVPAATMTSTYLYRQVGTGHSNAHPVYGKSVGGDLVATGWVIDYTGPDVNSDIFELSGDGASGKEFRVVGSLFLPNAAGTACGAFVNNSSGTTQTNTKIRFDHNTCYVGGVAAGNVFGVGAEAAGTTWAAGAVPSIRSNVLWSSSSNVGWIAQSSPGATVASNSITAADYNGLFNVTAPYGGAPTGQFAGTPGTHDVSGDPQFVGSARNMLSFDQGYLGNPVATGWVTATAYAAGDVVSAATVGFYSGATYNFRCVEAHTSSATDKPGSGANWSRYWEAASLKLISDDVLAGNTYAGGTNSLIGELVGWVKAGFAPQNAALNNAGHDGTTIGAVAYLALGGLPLLGGGLLSSPLFQGGLTR